MPAFFCAVCAVRTDNNTTQEKTTEAYNLICPCCWTEIRFYIKKPPTKTFTEAQKTFLDTPLTDSQRGTKKKKK